MANCEHSVMATYIKKVFREDRVRLILRNLM